MSIMKLFSFIKTFRPIRITQYALLLLVMLCSLFSLQCKKDLTTTSSSAKLTFSTNLLFFDTVFATGSTGSSVRIFVVHNNNSEAVNISSIRILGASASFYEVNVDGLTGPNLNNVKIPAKDSIYVFAQVNVNPLNTNNPLVIEDSLVFTTNGNVQSVHLQAFGWNAYYYVPNNFPKNGPAYYVPPCGAVWKNDKPHVIFGYLIVAPGCSLNIEQGAGVYFHDSAVLYVDSAATLNITGSPFEPVTFQGDRLEPAYKYIPGQWGEIFMYKSLNCNVSWAVIQNASTGIQVDTVAPGSSKPALSMDHTIITSIAGYGLLAEGATVEANNCLIADCQNNCIAMLYGGSYTFNLCTFADYWGVDNSYGSRTTPLLYMNNYYQSLANQTIYRSINKAFFDNCIIYGALKEELAFDSASTAGSMDVMNYYFANCILKTQQSFPNNHINNLIFLDPLFVNPSNDDYQVSPGSPALGKADLGFTSLYGPSLDNVRRPFEGATIGAYER